MQAIAKTEWVAVHNWWRCFRELDMMLLHWNLKVDYTDLSADKYKPADMTADAIMFPLYPDHEVIFLCTVQGSALPDD